MVRPALFACACLNEGEADIDRAKRDFASLARRSVRCLRQGARRRGRRAAVDPVRLSLGGRRASFRPHQGLRRDFCRRISRSGRRSGQRICRPCSIMPSWRWPARSQSPRKNCRRSILSDRRRTRPRSSRQDAADLGRMRRSFAFANHPDRVAPHLRQRAMIRMQVANMLIDEAKRRALAGARR